MAPARNGEPETLWVFDGHHCETNPERIRHIMIVEAFRARLRNDERTRAMWYRWLNADVGAGVREFATGLDRKASDLGLACRQELLSVCTAEGNFAGLGPIAMVAGLASVILTLLADDRSSEFSEDELDRFIDRLIDGDCPPGTLKQLAESFLRDTLKVPYPWYVDDILDFYLRFAFDYLLGVNFSRTSDWRELPVTIAPITLTFCPRDGEGFDEVFQRLDLEVAAYKQRLTDSRPPSTKRKYRPDQETIDMHVGWYYDHKVNDVAINKLEGFRTRATIYGGLEQVEKYLSIPPRGWGT